MGQRRRRALLAGGELVDDQGLVRGPGDLRGLDQPLGVGHALEQAGDGGAAGILGQSGDAIRHIHVAGVAAGHHAADRDATLHALSQGEAKIARLADYADRRRPGRDGGPGHRGEADRGTGGVVEHADAVRPDQAQPTLPRDVGDAGLQGDAIGPAGLGEAGGVDDGAADTGRDAVPHHALNCLHRRGDHGEVRRLRQGGDRGEAWQVP